MTRRRATRSRRPPGEARRAYQEVLVATYQVAIKARRDVEDLGTPLQVAMLLWKHIGDLDQAEEYFRRIRRLESAAPARARRR